MSEIKSDSGAGGTLNVRQQQILQRIMLEGEVKVADLKEQFDVTEMTIRRDLERLEAAGNIRRIFGGAIYLGRDVALQDRSIYLMEEKIQIGKRAAELVRANESLFIDGGTTTFQVARHLPPDIGITVVTNAMNVANELMNKGISTIVTGGILVEATSSLVGPIAVETLSRMAFDRIFLGTTGVNAEHGFSNSNVYEAEVKSMAIKQAAEVNIVADHSKFDAKVLFSFAPFHKVQRMITDRLPNEELVQICEREGVQLLLA